MPAVEIARDHAGIREFAGRYFEHAARLAAAGSHADRVPPAEIPAAYLGWIEFLLRVEAISKRCPNLLARIRADVNDGLDAIAAARSGFLRSHKQCGKCGNFAPRFAPACSCGEKF
jgi:hypothetical protein